jgi:hypothetical protein
VGGSGGSIAMFSFTETPSNPVPSGAHASSIQLKKKTRTSVQVDIINLLVSPNETNFYCLFSTYQLAKFPFNELFPLATGTR